MACIDHDNGYQSKLRIERNDWIAAILGSIAAIGGLFGAMTWYFQPIADSITTHKAMDERTAVIESDAALLEQALEIRKTYEDVANTARDAQINDIAKGMKASGDNTATIMRELEIRRRLIKPMPAGLGRSSMPVGVSIDPTNP